LTLKGFVPTQLAIPLQAHGWMMKPSEYLKLALQAHKLDLRAFGFPKTCPP
jgi:hypothetical protein